MLSVLKRSARARWCLLLALPLLPILSANAVEVRVGPLPAGAVTPDAEVDANGVIHVAYVRQNNAFYVRSEDEGRSFSRPIRINTEDDFVYAGAFRGPDLAIGGDGRVHVVWYNAGYQQKRPKEQWGVMYARLNNAQNSFEADRNLNHKPSDNFSLAADAQGNVAVVWMAEGLYVTLSRDGGTSFANPLAMPADPCECCSSRALASNKGQLYIAYREKADNLRDMHLLVQPLAGGEAYRSKTSQLAWPIDACPMTGNFLSFTRDGLLAGWETKGQIFFGHLDPDGNLKQAGEVLAAAKGRYPVALATAEATLVAWKQDKRLEWQLFSQQNKPTGRVGRHVAESGDRPAGVVTRGGDFLLFP
jgi:hypothetical protein